MEPAVPRHPLTADRGAAPDGPGAAARAAARAGLYVHVPFCATRCAYCEFSSGALSSSALGRYLDALDAEMRARAPAAAGLAFTSVFFGGGTPSALPGRVFARIAAGLRAHFTITPGAEVTLEANPESVRPALLAAWAAGGVGRLSMGAQSFVPAELAALGRLHDARRPGEAFALARAAGFGRLSLDLMFGFPGHSLETWGESLERALALEPEHLSAYCFIPEPGTPLGNDVLAGRAMLPGPEAQAEGYALLTERARAAGLGCYETSNFCLPDAECRHNLVYWLRRPYVGLGPSAHGLLGGVRYANHYALERWAAEIVGGGRGEAEREAGGEASMVEEVVMLGLRLATGLDLEDHESAVAEAVVRRCGRALDAAVAGGRLCARGRRWWIPARHRFVADDIIAWVAARAERAFDTPFDRSVRSSLPCPTLPSPVV